MKVLWLTHLPMPDLSTALKKDPSPRRGWTSALAEALVENSSVTLAVATAVKGQHFHKEIVRDILYYVLPLPKGNVNGHRLSHSLLWDYNSVINDFNPDVIHIHGTEYFQGLLTGRGYLKCPTLISVQGIIDVCQRYYFGNIKFPKLLTSRTLRDWVIFDGLIERKIEWARRAKWEREIFNSNQAFLGRTLWDRAHTRRLNPNARYHHCDEMLRKPFYGVQWDVKKINRHSIFASSAKYPLKGFHVLIKAVALLKPEFPDITVRTPLAHFYPNKAGIGRFWKNQRSTGYARYLTDLIRRMNLVENIVPLPSMDADGMVGELLRSHVFTLPSFIENSPNSLAEAMLVGTPSVASFVGGIQSMVQDEKSALLFPAGDEAVLAEQIRRIFIDDRLASHLSVCARVSAQARHAKEKIVKDLLEAYEYEINLQ